MSAAALVPALRARSRALHRALHPAPARAAAVTTAPRALPAEPQAHVVLRALQAGARARHLVK